VTPPAVSIVERGAAQLAYRVPPRRACSSRAIGGVGRDGKLPMEQIGALLATTTQVTPHRGDRSAPSAIPLTDVPEILLPGQLRSACADLDRAACIRRLAGRQACDLDAPRPAGTPRICRGRRISPSGQQRENRRLADCESARQLKELRSNPSRTL
jgi:hypothetical protein